MKRSPRPSLDRMLGPAVVALALLFACFELTPLDLLVQDRLYDFATHAWRVDEHAPGPRLLFYSGPKVLLILFAAGLLGLALGPVRWRARLATPPLRRRDLWVVLATLVSGPALIGLGKAVTNTFCPDDIRRYGGDVPYVRVLERYPENDRPARRGRGFPAGHASGGFALLSLAGLARTRRGRLAGLGIGLGAGGVMGGYQMLKGAHYLSHTVVTALVLWIVFLLWRRLLRAAFDRGGVAEVRA